MESPQTCLGADLRIVGIGLQDRVVGQWICVRGDIPIAPSADRFRLGAFDKL
jgi:hypothetical protein